MHCELELPSTKGSRYTAKSPTRLRNTRNMSSMGQFPKADTTNAVVPNIAARASADLAPVIGLDLELGLPHGLLYKRLLCQFSLRQECVGQRHTRSFSMFDMNREAVLYCLFYHFLLNMLWRLFVVRKLRTECTTSLGQRP